VLIAQKQVPAGTTWSDAVRGGYFSQENVPASAAPSSALSSTDASVPSDEVATADIASGQIVLRPMFGTKTPTTGVLAIPKGMQALSVTLPANADVAGFVQSGSQVAIYTTFKIAKPTTSNGNSGVQTGDTGGGADIYATKLLLPRVDVIATSQDAPSDLNGGKSAGNTSSNNVLLTLSVTQQQAERVILAQQMGTLYMSLLSDSSVTNEDGGTINVVTFKPTQIFVK
jgi:pilus assembly protein CpaB